jgi:hypothetical protein
MHWSHLKLAAGWRLNRLRLSGWMLLVEDFEDVTLAVEDGRTAG